MGEKAFLSVLTAGFILLFFSFFFFSSSIGSLEGVSNVTNSSSSLPPTAYSCSSYTPAFAGGSYHGLTRVNTTYFGVNCTTTKDN